MTEDNFLEMLCYIENDIKKQDTKFHQALPANIKLASNFGLLAPGAAQISFQWHNVVGLWPSISKIISGKAQGK